MVSPGRLACGFELGRWNLSGTCVPMWVTQCTRGLCPQGNRIWGQSPWEGRDPCLPGSPRGASPLCGKKGGCRFLVQTSWTPWAQQRPGVPEGRGSGSALATAITTLRLLSANPQRRTLLSVLPFLLDMPATKWCRNLGRARPPRGRRRSGLSLGPFCPSVPQLLPTERITRGCRGGKGLAVSTPPHLSSLREDKQQGHRDTGTLWSCQPPPCSHELRGLSPGLW